MIRTQENYIINKYDINIRLVPNQRPIKIEKFGNIKQGLEKK